MCLYGPQPCERAYGRGASCRRVFTVNMGEARHDVPCCYFVRSSNRELAVRSSVWTGPDIWIVCPGFMNIRTLLLMIRLCCGCGGFFWVFFFFQAFLRAS